MTLTDILKEEGKEWLDAIGRYFKHNWCGLRTYRYKDMPLDLIETYVREDHCPPDIALKKSAFCLAASTLAGLGLEKLAERYIGPGVFSASLPWLTPAASFLFYSVSELSLVRAISEGDLRNTHTMQGKRLEANLFRENSQGQSNLPNGVLDWAENWSRDIMPTGIITGDFRTNIRKAGRVIRRNAAAGILSVSLLWYTGHNMNDYVKKGYDRIADRPAQAQKIEDEADTSKLGRQEKDLPKNIFGSKLTAPKTPNTVSTVSEVYGINPITGATGTSMTYEAAQTVPDEVEEPAGIKEKIKDIKNKNKTTHKKDKPNPANQPLINLLDSASPALITHPGETAEIPDASKEKPSIYGLNPCAGGTIVLDVAKSEDKKNETVWLYCQNQSFKIPLKNDSAHVYDILGAFVELTGKKALAAKGDVIKKEHPVVEGEKVSIRASFKTLKDKPPYSLENRAFVDLYQPQKEERKEVSLFRISSTGLAAGLSSPVNKPILTSDFGWRDYPLDPKIRQQHRGIDLDADTGDKIVSACDGIAVYAGWGKESGNLVTILCNSLVHVNQNGRPTKINILTDYAHLDEIKISDGDKVKKGHTIGLAGSTGNSTGPHLHFAVKTDRPIAGYGIYHPPNSQFWYINPIVDKVKFLGNGSRVAMNNK